MFDKKRWRQEHKEATSKYMKIYYQEHREELLKRMKQYQKNNPEKIKKVQRIWIKNNPEKFRIIQNRWLNKEYRINPKFKLDKKMKQVIKNSLKNNSKGEYWEELLGYTSNELKKHLQKTLPNNYYWRDYLEGKLHIDHIIPKSAFNYTKVEHQDFQRCWDLSNLRLLPAKENRIKKDKLCKPFQPALRI